MSKKLSNIVSDVSAKLGSIRMLLRELKEEFVFAQFKGDEPEFVIKRMERIVLEYHCMEMSIEEAIERMDEYGYITPDDF